MVELFAGEGQFCTSIWIVYNMYWVYIQCILNMPIFPCLGVHIPHTQWQREKWQQVNTMAEENSQ